MATINPKSSNANRSNQFGTSPQTPNKQWLNSWPNYFLTQDATSGTPNQSPLTVASNADTVLQVPAAAVQLMIVSSAALRVNDASPASAPYFVIPANTPYPVPCLTPTSDPNSTSGYIYLRADSGSATVQFMFLCV